MALRRYRDVDSDDFLNEVPEHMAQEYVQPPPAVPRRPVLNEVPEHMAQESTMTAAVPLSAQILNEVPEHMAQECDVDFLILARLAKHSSMKFLSTWLRNTPRSSMETDAPPASSMKFRSTWLRRL